MEDVKITVETSILLAKTSFPSDMDFIVYNSKENNGEFRFTELPSQSIVQQWLREHGYYIQHWVILSNHTEYKFYLGKTYLDKTSGKMKYEDLWNPVIKNNEGKITGYLYFKSYEEGLEEIIKESLKYIYNGRSTSNI